MTNQGCKSNFNTNPSFEKVDLTYIFIDNFIKIKTFKQIT